MVGGREVKRKCAPISRSEAIDGLLSRRGFQPCLCQFHIRFDTNLRGPHGIHLDRTRVRFDLNVASLPLAAPVCAACEPNDVQHVSCHVRCIEIFLQCLVALVRTNAASWNHGTEFGVEFLSEGIIVNDASGSNIRKPLEYCCNKLLAITQRMKFIGRQKDQRGFTIFRHNQCVAALSHAPQRSRDVGFKVSECHRLLIFLGLACLCTHD